MMIRFLSIFSLLAVSIVANAQLDSVQLEFGRNKMIVNANGTLFKSSETEYLHEFPKGSGNHLLGFQGFWIGAKDNSGKLYTSIATGKNGLDEWWPGPIDTLIGPVQNPEFWNSVWVVSKAEIDSHIVNWNKTGYQAPPTIAYWPAKNPEQNVRANMAPYADANLNGVYDPENGDYPLVKGDIAAYYIMNDAYGEHKVSGGLKMNCEVHGMSYAFLSGKDTNVLFNEYYLINVSNTDFDTVLLGIYNDIVLGNPDDNFIGTYVDLRTVYAYNGDADDEGHYADQKPVVALVGLDQDLAASMAFNGAKDMARTNPTVHLEYWNALNAKWQDGRSLTFGADGRDVLNPKTQWIYPGDTDPSITGTWNDENSGDTPGKRNILGVYGPFKLKADSYININTAVIWQTKYEISTFRNRISALINDHGTPLYLPALATDPLNMWPNPVISGQLLHFDSKVTDVEIWDISGSRLNVYKMNENMKMQCSVSMPPGVYCVKAINNGSFAWAKLVVQ